jgi:periplasmic protein TonB
MEPNDMLYADPLDILFENRNKAYGAYPLRKYYAQRLYISMVITLSLVALISFLYLAFQTRTGNATFCPPLPDINFNPVDLTPPPKPIPPPVKPSAPKAPIATIPETPPLIIHDNIPIPPIATLTELDQTAIGVKTLAGGPDNGGIQNNGNSKVTEIPAAPVERKSEVFERAEIMPEFPGGVEALKRYLVRNLQMPESNLEPGSTIQVIARFVVGEDGKVRDIEIIKEAEAAFNAEVKRVISKMPDWKPGSQNHRSVAVYFNLPVNFVSAE